MARMSICEHPVRILIADDQRHAREGLLALLGTCSDFEIVGTAADGREALELATDRDAEIVIMDMRMPIMDGLEATRRLKRAKRVISVLVHTIYGYAAADAGAAGADAFLEKGAAAGRLIRTLRQLAKRHRPSCEDSS